MWYQLNWALFHLNLGKDIFCLNILLKLLFALQGNIQFIKLLLSKNALWREKDLEGLTAIHLSTRHKSPKCLALLMKQLEPAEVDEQDKNKVRRESWMLQPWPTIFAHSYSIKLFHMILCNYHSGCIKRQCMLLLGYKHTQTTNP